MASSFMAVACYEDSSNKNYGTCSALSLGDDNTLSKGANLVVNAGSTNHLSVSMASRSVGVMCYEDSSNSSYGICNALSLSGSTLSKGADLIVNAGSTGRSSVSMTNSKVGVMCYEDSSNSNYGTCNALSLSGSTLSKGADLVANAGTTTNHLSVSLVSNSMGVICYEDSSNNNYGTCNVIDIKPCLIGYFPGPSECIVSNVTRSSSNSNTSYTLLGILGLLVFMVVLVGLVAFAGYCCMKRYQNQLGNTSDSIYLVDL